MRQLFAGRDTATDGMLFISYDKLPKHTTIAQFAHTTGAYAPGVLAGSPDDKNLWDLWGVIESVERGSSRGGRHLQSRSPCDGRERARA
jgi:hypothetical protein